MNTMLIIVLAVGLIFIALGCTAYNARQRNWPAVMWGITTMLSQGTIILTCLTLRRLQ